MCVPMVAGLCVSRGGWFASECSVPASLSGRSEV